MKKFKNKIEGILKKKMSRKKILKGAKSVLIIKAHKNVPYKSNYFKEEEISNDFLFGK